MANGNAAATPAAKSPTTAGIEAGAHVIHAASKRDPVLVLALLIGAAMMAGALVWMSAEMKTSRSEMTSVMDHHETEGHHTSVSDVELSAFKASMERSLASIQAEMRANNAAMAARIDRLLERDK